MNMPVNQPSAAEPERESAARQEIWIEWGGCVYGPYHSPAEALRNGFYLPADGKAAR